MPEFFNGTVGLCGPCLGIINSGLHLAQSVTKRISALPLGPELRLRFLRPPLHGAPVLQRPVDPRLRRIRSG
jgi:hypothetical protein